MKPGKLRMAAVTLQTCSLTCFGSGERMKGKGIMPELYELGDESFYEGTDGKLFTVKGEKKRNNQ